MNMNFERLRLQMHFRRLYEALGAHDAELVIVDAFQRELARHETKLQQQARTRETHSGSNAKHQTANDSDLLDKSLDI